jgi:signal recognition particle receptor subunit beta
MALVNVAKREINCKIVYYGAGFSGKTTNLQFIHAHSPLASRGELMALATERERTLAFEFMPLDLGAIHGFQVRFHLYTVPGQVLYETTRRAVLENVDGVVFVADSTPAKFDENYQSLVELEGYMRAMRKDLGDFPFVMQWNKRDAVRAVPVETLESYLNRRGVRSFPAVAVTGDGVFATLLAICRAVMARL